MEFLALCFVGYAPSPALHRTWVAKEFKAPKWRYMKSASADFIKKAAFQEGKRPLSTEK
jgi:hypothetical protein